MKTLTCIFFFCLSPFLLIAQSNFLQKSELESTFGLVKAGSKFGIFGGLEGRYNYSSQFSFGLKYDSFFLLEESEFNENGFKPEEKYGIQAISVTSDYYFGKERKNLFVGMEASVFIAHLAQDSNESKVKLGTKFGFTPRIGIELGAFRPALKYNFIPKFGKENLSSLALSLGLTIGEKNKKNK